MARIRSKALLPSHRHDQLKASINQVLGALVLVLFCANVFWIWRSLSDSNTPILGRLVTSSKPNEADTLIIYSFRYTDPETLNNLAFFIEFGILADDSARYIIAMDPTVPDQELPDLPKLPPNAEMVKGPNCFECGMAGWILFTSSVINVKDFKYFVFVSSSMLGPILPAYYSDRWHTVFTRKLNRQVKLVGPTISCTSLVFDVDQGPIAHPHVQNAVMATDSIGLKLLKKGGALDCHSRWLDNLRYAEFGSSQAILKAGYTIDSLMMRYQAVNWKDEQASKCNAQMDPTRPHTYDGTSLNPMEVVFMKSDLASMIIQDPVVSQAVLYSEWIEARRKNQAQDISSNKWISEASKYREAIMSQPSVCFDHEFYIMASPAEFEGFSAEEAYSHFRNFGYREGRPYSFLC